MMDKNTHIDLAEFIPSRYAVKLFPEDLSRRLQVLPVSFERKLSELVLARSGTPGLPVKDSVRRVVDKAVSIKWVQAKPLLIESSIDKCYCYEHDVHTLFERCWKNEPQLEDDGSPVCQSIAMPELMDALLCAAYERRASDIHISATDKTIEFKLRVDGVMSRLGQIPRGYFEALTVRIKVIAELDIAESRRPQDGQFRRLIHGSSVECRVSTFPTCRGENIVLRLLAKVQQHKTLDELKLPSLITAQLRALIHQPNGMIIVCGPTGSGKSSTLFSLLAERDTDTLNVMSLEDPVETRVPGICQSNVDEERGLDFAAGVRALLRQDPDILLIGEMRDADSAAMAFRAAMTGHQVLTTLHSADAITTIDRLRELGVSAEVLASTVRGIVAQRLLRTRCGCDKGCQRCHRSGYFGRRAVIEVLRFTSSFTASVKAQLGTEALIACAKEDGFSGLRDHAIALQSAGLTTQSEIVRVLGDEGITQ